MNPSLKAQVCNIARNINMNALSRMTATWLFVAASNSGIISWRKKKFSGSKNMKAKEFKILHATTAQKRFFNNLFASYFYSQSFHQLTGLLSAYSDPHQRLVSLSAINHTGPWSVDVFRNISWENQAVSSRKWFSDDIKWLIFMGILANDENEKRLWLNNMNDEHTGRAIN